MSNSIFISSTFKDMQSERDLLHKYIMPKVNEKLSMINESLRAIDLRWGIFTSNLNEIEMEKKIFTTCFDEIDDSRPYFLCFLGERYGYSCDIAKFKETMKYAKNGLRAIENTEKTSGNTSITSLEILYATIIAENIDRCLFYIREPINSKNMDCNTRNMYFPENDFDAVKQKELINFVKENFKDQCRIYKAKYNPKENGLNFDKKFINSITKDIFSLLAKNKKKINRSFDEEIKEYQEFYINEKSSSFFAREEEISHVNDFLNSESSILHIKGESGCGKTSLMCKIVETNKEKIDFIPVFCGATKKLSSELGVLEYLYYTLARLYGNELQPIERFFLPQERFSKKQMLIDLIRKYIHSFIYRETQSRPLVFIIDAINQLNSYENLIKMSILPYIYSTSQNNLKFIITSTPNIKLNLFTIKLYNIVDMHLLDIRKDEIENVVQSVLKKLHHKELSSKIISSIKNKKCAINCLYLQLIMQRLVIIDKYEFESISEIEKSSEEKNDARENYFIKVIKSIPDNIDEAINKIIIDIQKKFKCDMKSILEFIAISENGLNIEALSYLLNNAFEESQFLVFRRYLSMFIGVKYNGEYFFQHDAIRKAILVNISPNETESYEKTLLNFYKINNNEFQFDTELFNLYYSLSQYGSIAKELLNRSCNINDLTFSNDIFVSKAHLQIHQELNNMIKSKLLYFFCKNKKTLEFACKCIIDYNPTSFSNINIDILESYCSDLLSSLTFKNSKERYIFSSAILSFIYKNANCNDHRNYNSDFMLRISKIIDDYLNENEDSMDIHFGIYAKILQIKNNSDYSKFDNKIAKLLKMIQYKENYENTIVRAELYYLQFENPHDMSENGYICECFYNIIGELQHQYHFNKLTYQQKIIMNKIVAKLAIILCDSDTVTAEQLFVDYSLSFFDTVINDYSLEMWNNFSQYLYNHACIWKRAIPNTENEKVTTKLINAEYSLKIAGNISRVIFELQPNQINANYLINILVLKCIHSTKLNVCSKQKDLFKYTQEIEKIASKIEDYDIEYTRGLCFYLNGYFNAEYHRFKKAIELYKEANKHLNLSKTYNDSSCLQFEILSDLIYCRNKLKDKELFFTDYVDSFKPITNALSNKKYISLNLMKIIQNGLMKDCKKIIGKELIEDIEIELYETLYTISRTIHDIELKMNSASIMISCSMALYRYYKSVKNWKKISEIEQIFNKDINKYMLYVSQEGDERDLLNNANTLFYRAKRSNSYLEKRLYMKQIDRIGCSLRRFSNSDSALICFILALEVQKDISIVFRYSNNSYHDLSICYSVIIEEKQRNGKEIDVSDWVQNQKSIVFAFLYNVVPNIKVSDAEELIENIKKIPENFLFIDEISHDLEIIFTFAQEALDFIGVYKKPRSMQFEHDYIFVGYITQLFYLKQNNISKAGSAFLEILTAVNNLMEKDIKLEDSELNMYFHAMEKYVEFGGEILLPNNITLEEYLHPFKVSGLYNDNIIKL